MSFSAQDSFLSGHHAKPPRQAVPQASSGQPYQVPSWRLLGTSPLHEGQQGIQGHHPGQGSQRQPQGIQQQPQGIQQQPLVPQWRLLGTSPLHEGHMQSESRPTANDQSWGQGIGQGSQQQPYRADWHLLGTSPMLDGVDYSTSTSQSSFSQGRGSLAQPLTYASMAIGSWTDSSVTARQHLGKQVRNWDNDDLKQENTVQITKLWNRSNWQTASGKPGTAARCKCCLMWTPDVIDVLLCTWHMFVSTDVDHEQL